MPEVLLGNRAEVFDVDGTLVQRHPVVRVFSALKSRSPLGKQLSCSKLAELPLIGHQRIEEKVIGWWGRWILTAHINRVAIPTIKGLLIQSAEEGADIFILTGRSSDADWFDGTARQLEREGILPFVSDPNRRLHTPHGTPNTLSKIHALSVIAKFYQTTRMTDDDWPTIEMGARLLPRVDFRYVYGGFPCFYPSTKDLSTYPNVSVLDLTKS